MSDRYCDDCGGRLDQVGEHGCRLPPHPEPDLAQRIVEIVESEVNDRRGLKWAGLDEDILIGLRDSLAEQIRAELQQERGAQP